jgi:hypothetical protein
MLHVKRNICCAFLLFITSCNKQQRLAKESEFTVQASFADEARLVDVPVPLNTRLKHSSVAHHTDTASDEILVFSSLLLPADLCEFYRTEMEVYGWSLVKNFITPTEFLLLYEKPYRWCCISYHSFSQSLTITLGPKVIARSYFPKAPEAYQQAY